MKENGEVTLADVVASIKQLGDRLDARIDKLDDDLNGRIDQLEKAVNRRFDGALKMLGGYHRDHERRITALEKKKAG